jgi:hypothetical protein
MPNLSPRKWPRTLLVVLAGIVFVPMPYAWLSPEGLHDLTNGAYTTTGTFIPNGAYPTVSLVNPADRGRIRLGSWGGSDANVGSFQSAPFPGPEHLSFLVAGRPSTPGLRIFLRDDRNAETLPLKTTCDPDDTWSRETWALPDSWRGRMVRLIVEDEARGPGGWIGVSLPESGVPNSYPYELFHEACLQFALVIEAGLFLLPGFAMVLLLDRRRQLDFPRWMAVLLIGSALVAYFFFWAYFANRAAARFLSLALFVALPFLCFRLARKVRPNAAVLREAAGCLILTFLVAGFYMACDHLFVFGSGSGVQEQRRVMPWLLPTDNILPFVFAEKLYTGTPVRPYLQDTWKSSDRPPLQTGATLMQFPVWPLLKKLHYHLLSTFLQALWVPALWIFLRRARAGLRVILAVLACCAFSGFFFLNTIYVWPKLLAAALALVGLSFSPLARSTPYRFLDAVLLGAGIALGALSHTGILLTIPGWVALYIFRRFRLPRRSLATGVIVLLVLFLPWTLYQKLYDPPGDKLMKMHLAGDAESSRGLLQTISASYSKLSAATIVHNKLENLRVLFLRRNGYDSGILDGFLASNFFCVFQSLGILNIGFVLLGYRWLRPKGRASPELAAATRVLAVAATATLLWCGVMFGAGEAIIHQGSPLTMMLLFMAGSLGLIGMMPELPDNLIFFLVVAIFLHVGVVFPIILFGNRQLMPNPAGEVWNDPLDGGAAAMAVVLLVVAVWAAARLLRSEPSETGPSEPAKAAANTNPEALLA